MACARFSAQMACAGMKQRDPSQPRGFMRSYCGFFVDAAEARHDRALGRPDGALGTQAARATGGDMWRQLSCVSAWCATALVLAQPFLFL